MCSQLATVLSVKTIYICHGYIDVPNISNMIDPISPEIFYVHEDSLHIRVHILTIKHNVNDKLISVKYMYYLEELIKLSVQTISNIAHMIKTCP